MLAPCYGVIKLLFKTNHAFAIVTDKGAEVLVHIGIDTVHMKGEGFIRIAEEGQTVKVGDEIIKLDRKLMESKGCDLTTCVLITNQNEINSIDYKYSNNAKAEMDSSIYPFQLFLLINLLCI